MLFLFVCYILLSWKLAPSSQPGYRYTNPVKGKVRGHLKFIGIHIPVNSIVNQLRETDRLRFWDLDQEMQILSTDLRRFV